MKSLHVSRFLTLASDFAIIQFLRFTSKGTRTTGPFSFVVTTQLNSSSVIIYFEMREKVPITNFHCKKCNVLLDKRPVLGQIRVLTSSLTGCLCIKCSPTIAYASMITSIQCSTTASIAPLRPPWHRNTNSGRRSREGLTDILKRLFVIFILNSVPFIVS